MVVQTETLVEKPKDRGITSRTTSIMREQWRGRMAEYNSCCSNQSFSGLTTSPFQDYKYSKNNYSVVHVPNITTISQHKLPTQQTDKHTAQQKSPTRQTDKHNDQQKSPTRQTDKHTAQQKSPTRQTNKPSAKHNSQKQHTKPNILNGINFAYSDILILLTFLFLEGGGGNISKKNVFLEILNLKSLLQFTNI